MNRLTFFHQGLRHEFESGGEAVAKLAKVGGQGFSPFTVALKLLASQEVEVGGNGGMGPVHNVI